VTVTITRFRKELFSLVNHALDGEPLEFVHKGVIFRVVPEVKLSKLSKLTGQKVVAPDTNLKKASRELLKQMESEWEEDWSEL
jgi:hypothetical protein